MGILCAMYYHSPGGVTAEVIGDGTFYMICSITTVTLQEPCSVNGVVNCCYSWHVITMQLAVVVTAW